MPSQMFRRDPVTAWWWLTLIFGIMILCAFKLAIRG
jgi:hypothetical protein